MQLETARLALFRNDDLSYHASLDTANEWLTRYFNTDAGSTASMQDAIERLNETKLDAPLPDISGSLNSLREILAQKSVHVIKQKRPSPLVAPATSASEGETGSTETGSAASASGTGKAVGSGQKADGGISP